MADYRRVIVDRARPAASRSRAKHSMSAAADSEQPQLAAMAPGDELAQVDGVRLPGHAGIPGQETGSGQPLLITEHRLGQD